ncbi:hypothetical protein Ancab_002766 [Ancistrocladus abbreviatus]
MKRKRGHKKGKGKKSPEVGVNEASSNAVSPNEEGNSESDDLDYADSETKMSAKTPSSVGTDQQDKFISINPDMGRQRPAPTAVYGRVKVKLKTSKPLEAQVTSSYLPTQSDTDKSSQQMSVYKQGVVAEKMVDSANSLPELGIAAVENPSRKAGSIKIKSSIGLGSPYMTQNTNALSLPGEGSQQEEPKLPFQDPRDNKLELEASLEVIKTVMKMDAAEPFTVPVNPIELGIPDYFDVIDTPMDFGTICSGLENGIKYKNSEDVYKDVQYIWENCYKYNNKGDYIVDLMKRVKKNFMKYWTAAGLYTEQSRGTNGVESTEDGTPSTHEKKQKKGKGVKRHKDGCLCAICIMKRRRREREAWEAREARGQAPQNQYRTTDASLAQESKQQGNAHLESPRGNDTSSCMETSPDVDAEAELEDTGGEDMTMEAATPQIYVQKEENEIDLQDEGDRSGDVSEKSRGNVIDNESYPNVSGGRIKSEAQKQIPVQQDGQPLSQQQQKYELLELEKMRQRSRLYEKFLNLENPMLLKLCGTLFTDNPTTLWNGPHSLVRSQKSIQNTGIHAAVASFMNSSSKFASK